MILTNEITMPDNDAYKMGQTKNFLVINNNYNGFRLYSPKLEYIKSIIFYKEISLYQMYTSSLNDKVVFLDDNKLTLNIIDLSLNSPMINETKCNEVFFSYYKANQNDFWLTDSSYLYNFSYKDMTLIQKIPSNGKDRILSQHSNEFVFVDKFENVIYCKDNTKTLISRHYQGSERFLTYNGKIVKYTENSIFVYNCIDNDLIARDSITIANEFSISQVCINEGKIFVLSYLKSDVKLCNIKEYCID